MSSFVFLLVLTTVLALSVYIKFVVDPPELKQKYSIYSDKERREVVRYFYYQKGKEQNFLRKRYNPCWSDEQYNSYVTERLASNLDEAINALGIDRFVGIQTIHMSHYLLTPGHYKKTISKEEYVSSYCNDVWIFFTNEQLLIFEKTIDLLLFKRNMKTVEFFYRDITSIETQNIEKERTDGYSLSEGTFVIKTSGSDSFECCVDDDDDAVECIQEMRKILREKKANMG